MSNDATPRLALPYVAAGQAQKHVTVNEAFARLDGLVQMVVETQTLASAPNAPKDGSLYIASATVAPLIDAAGRTTHYMCIKQDITAQKAA